MTTTTTSDECATLLAIARNDLRRAAVLPAAERYRTALAVAVRAAAAVLAATARPAAVRRGPCGVWELAGRHAPALREWTDFFALAAVRPTGPGRAPVGEREADDLLRDAGRFLSAVETRAVETRAVETRAVETRAATHLAG